ncbi:MAG: protein-disulfide reductase DsbD [Porticoccaceae bacterium]
MPRAVNTLTRTLLIALLALIGAGAWADSLRFGGDVFANNNNSSQTTFLPVEQAYQLHPRLAGDDLVLDWQIAPGYYLYQEQFKAVLLRPGAPELILETQFVEGVRRYDDYYARELEVYYDTTSVTVPLPALTDAVQVRVSSQGCADAGLCYPPRTHLVTIDPITSVVRVSDALPGSAPAPVAETRTLPVILAFALIGGLILNLMPCVFPVLSIKVMSLTASSTTARGRYHHGLAYTAGVVASFVAVALLLIALRAGGEALGWGFQLQSPGFVIALTYLFFVMGLSFSGFFQAGTALMNLGQSASQGNGLGHSFFTGVLATAVASPCSAPFMGAALGFALTQATATALLVFAALGFGMALPFLVLTCVPGLMRRLPRPGPWMETLKELLAFPLYLTSIWLLWILGRQTNSDMLSLTLVGLTALTFAIWLWNRGGRAARALAVLAVFAAIFYPFRELSEEPQASIWEPYSAARLERLLGEKRNVFVNLTADWCITCLANERVALSSSDFANLLEERNIVYLKGDWTNQDAEITALLNDNGRSGVPLYLYYSRGKAQPQILPQILSPGIVRDTLSSN